MTGLDAALLAEVEFVRLVEARRREVGLSQRGLGTAAGLSEATVSRLVSGQRNPTLATLVKLAPPLRLRIVVEGGTIRGERL